MCASFVRKRRRQGDKERVRQGDKEAKRQGGWIRKRFSLSPGLLVSLSFLQSISVSNHRASLQGRQLGTVYCRSVSLAAAAMGAKIISGSQAASDATSQPLAPSCWQASETSMKTVTTARQSPSAMNGLRLLRVTTNGRPRKRSVVSSSGRMKRL